MNVYFLGNSLKADGCYYVRCLLPLQANYWWGQQVSLNAKPDSEKSLLQGIYNADVVVFHRPINEKYLSIAKKLKLLGKKIVFDNDDTFSEKSGFPLRVVGFKTEEENIKKLKKLNKKLYDFIEVADVVTVSTEFLAQEYRKIHKNVFVMPNTVKASDYYHKRYNETDKVRICIQGSVLFSKDYKVIEDILIDLSKDKRVRLVIWGLPPKTNDYKYQNDVLYKEQVDFVSSLDCEWHPVVDIKDYFFKLNDLRLDMLLIPRIDNYFNRCKSNIKFLEASMYEIPVIAQGFTDGNSPYQKDGDNVIICITKEDWRKNVESLIANRELRESLGKKAKQYVLENYEISKKAHLWAELYKNICEK